MVKVKSLVWREINGDGEFADRVWISDTYAIDLRMHAEVFDLVCLLWDSPNAVRFDSLEAAKAAAQSDYEARILAALEPE